MKYIILGLLSLFCLSSPQLMYAQQKPQKIKPTYFGKLQGGYLVDKVKRHYSGFNYVNLGLRKVKGSKISEWGIETFYYKKVRKIEVRQFQNVGYQQKGFGLGLYHYFMLKSLDIGKVKVLFGSQTSLNYYWNENLPFSTNGYPITFKYFTLDVVPRLELNYKIGKRYTILLGGQYILAQTGLKRRVIANPNLVSRQQIDKAFQFDFLVDRYIVHLGVLAQFGKVKVDRVQLRKQREAERQRKKDKLTKKQKKKAKQLEKKASKKKKKN